MDKSEILSRLADLVGIETVYWDIFGHRNEASLETKQAMMAAMGMHVESERAAAECMHTVTDQPWRRWVRPITVLRRGRPFAIPLAIPADVSLRPIAWMLDTEGGHRISGRLLPGALAPEESHDVEGARILRTHIDLPEDIPDGYHTLTLTEGNAEVIGQVVVAPAQSYLPDWFAADQRRWGVAAHVYSLRSDNDWGIGDFSSLQGLATALRGTGAVAIGVNPLHALFPHNPLHCSPYSPSSRLFLNPLYIDINAVPELDECDRAKKRIKSAKFQKRLELARTTGRVDYPAVAGLKFEALELLHACFEARHPPGKKADERRRDFERFVAEGGEALLRFATYQVLVETHGGSTWRQWAPELQKADSPAVRAFAETGENAKRIGYHLYLQWEADRQLGRVDAACREAGLSVGLYRDLAVGVDPQGPDVWGNQPAFADAHVGAPPDQFNAKGQDWGTPPFNPVRLHETAYADFIAVLRANMRHAGALRIDHVMALMHLFWIPVGGDPSVGAYMKYPFDDLLGIVALESHRHRCMVIGEDLGTVPPEFRDRMTVEGILSYRVAMFERWPGEGYFKRPGIYPPVALATASTHDLPTIAGHWHGSDVALKQEMGLVSDDQPAEALIEGRIQDRRLLRAALIDQGLLGEGFPIDPDLDDAGMRALVLAVHRFLARSSSRFMLVQLDDLLLETTQLNLPGTVDEYPNWKRKLSRAVESLAGLDYLKESAAVIEADRRAPPASP